MKGPLVLLAFLALVPSKCFSAELPEAPPIGIIRVTPSSQPPVKRPFYERISVVDLTLYTAVIATHIGDWASTQECLRISREQESEGFVATCHEALLPSALVESKVGLGAYEASTAGLEIYAQHFLTERGHKHFARFAQLVNIGGTAYVVLHNYHNDRVAAHP
jgi:hypothetical protein